MNTSLFVNLSSSQIEPCFEHIEIFYERDKGNPFPKLKPLWGMTPPRLTEKQEGSNSLETELLQFHGCNVFWIRCLAFLFVGCLVWLPFELGCPRVGEGSKGSPCWNVFRSDKDANRTSCLGFLRLGRRIYRNHPDLSMQIAAK